MKEKYIQQIVDKSSERKNIKEELFLFNYLLRRTLGDRNE